MDHIPVCALTGQVAMQSFGRQALQESSDEEVAQIKGKNAAARIRQESKSDKYHPETLIADIHSMFSPKTPIFLDRVNAAFNLFSQDETCA